MVAEVENTIENDERESYIRRYKHKAIDGNDDFGKSKFIGTECLCALRVLSVKIYVTSVNASNLIVFSWMSKKKWEAAAAVAFTIHKPSTNRPNDRFIPFSCCGFVYVCVYVWWENSKSGYRKIGSRRLKGWIRTLAPIDPNDLIKNIEAKIYFIFRSFSLSLSLSLFFSIQGKVSFPFRKPCIM